MLEFETGCLERLPPKLPENLSQRRIRPRGDRQATAVDRIADERMPEMLKMHSYLVRAPGLKSDAAKGMCTIPFAHPIVCHCRPAPFANGHSRAVYRVPPDRPIDTTAGSQHAMADRPVFTANLPRLHRTSKTSQRG